MVKTIDLDYVPKARAYLLSLNPNFEKDQVGNPRAAIQTCMDARALLAHTTDYQNKRKLVRIIGLYERLAQDRITIFPEKRPAG